MTPETREALEQALAREDLEMAAVIMQYEDHGWDRMWPWHIRPLWLQERYASWTNYRDHLNRLARGLLEEMP